MIIAKATVFFTALAVSTFSVISAQTPVDDAVVEIDAAIRKTKKMPKNKKGRKGGKAVHTKSQKKGKKSTSPNSSSTVISPSSSSTTISPSSSPTSSLTSSPTGVCEQLLVTRMAYEIDGGKIIYDDYIKTVSEDPLLSTVEAVGTLLKQAASVNAAVESALFGEATGCDYDASLENYDSTLFENYNSLIPNDSPSSRRHLEEESVRPASESSSPEMGRKLQGNPLDDPEMGRILDDIVNLATTIIRLFLSEVIQLDKLNKVYPLYMGLLGEIICSYYALSLAVVDIVKALTQGTADLSSFHEGVMKSTLIEYETTDFFPEVFSIPTVFDAAECGSFYYS